MQSCFNTAMTFSRPGVEEHRCRAGHVSSLTRSRWNKGFGRGFAIRQVDGDRPCWVHDLPRPAALGFAEELIWPIHGGARLFRVAASRVNSHDNRTCAGVCQAGE